MPIPNTNSSDINLIPDNAIQKASVSQQIFRLMLKRGKTLIVITEAIVLMVFLSRFKIDRQINDITENVDNKAAIIKSSQNLEKEHERIQSKLAVIQNITESQIKWNDVIGNFDQKIPTDITLEFIDYSANKINFRAKVQNPASFGFFIENLKSDPNIQGVTLESSRYVTDSKSYDFSMVVELKNIKNQ